MLNNDEKLLWYNLELIDEKIIFELNWGIFWTYNVSIKYDEYNSCTKPDWYENTPNINSQDESKLTVVLTKMILSELPI